MLREIFKGFLMLRLLAGIPLLVIIVVLVGVSALTGGSDMVAIVIFAVVPVVAVAAFGWLMTRRIGKRRR